MVYIRKVESPPYLTSRRRFNGQFFSTLLGWILRYLLFNNQKITHNNGRYSRFGTKLLLLRFSRVWHSRYCTPECGIQLKLNFILYKTTTKLIFFVYLAGWKCMGDRKNFRLGILQALRILLHSFARLNTTNYGGKETKVCTSYSVARWNRTWSSDRHLSFHLIPCHRHVR